MYAYGTVNLVSKNYRVEIMVRPQDRERFLRGLGLTVQEEAVKAVIGSCSGAFRCFALEALHTGPSRVSGGKTYGLQDQKAL